MAELVFDSWVGSLRLFTNVPEVDKTELPKINSNGQTPTHIQTTNSRMVSQKDFSTWSLWLSSYYWAHEKEKTLYKCSPVAIWTEWIIERENLSIHREKVTMTLGAKFGSIWWPDIPIHALNATLMDSLNATLIAALIIAIPYHGLYALPHPYPCRVSSCSTVGASLLPVYDLLFIGH